jgi:hypothetical protein
MIIRALPSTTIVPEYTKCIESLLSPGLIISYYSIASNLSGNYYL